MGDIDTRNASGSQAARLLRIALMVGASTLATGLAATPAMAQDQQAGTEGTPAAVASGDDEEIVVTGIRASLEKSMDIKRDASGVVDAISAEDIGKFPDTNLAESLQRIPGVSISRVNGEGSQVTVRGFGPTFNLVTLDGRQMPTSSVGTVGGDQNVDFSRATSRSFDFSNIASEGVSRLEVFKTGRAAVPSGGIGATINIVTQHPFDVPGEGLRGSIGAKAIHDSGRDSFTVTPEISGLATYTDADETFGVSAFASYGKNKSAAASSTVNDWNITGVYSGRGTQHQFYDTGGPFINPQTQITGLPTADQLVAIPNDSRYHYSTSEHERFNGELTLQFRPMDTLTLTANGLYAVNKYVEQRSDQTNWFNRPFTQVRFDDNPIVATTEFIQENENPVKDIGFEQQYRASKDQLHDFGLNANWEITDSLTLNLDGHTGKSKSTPDAPNGSSSTLVSFGAPVVSSHSVEFTNHGIPIQLYNLNDAVKGNNNGVLDIGDLGTQVQRTNASRQDQKIDQLRADLGWALDDEVRFDVGMTWTKSKMTSQRTQTQQTLGNWGIEHVGDVAQYAGDLINQYCLACKFDDYDPGDAEIAFRGNAIDLYDAFRAAYEAQGHQVDVTGNDFDQVEEKIWGGFAQLSWNGEIGGRPAGLLAGVRYENTKVISNALIGLPSAIVWQADNDFTRVISADTSPVTLKGEYNNLLPAFDFRIEPMDKVVARVSYSKTLARPDYGNLFASQTANAPNRPTALGGTATGASGNPGLKPLVSDNFDVSLEWYFDRSSYISGGFFYKHVKNFVGVGNFDQNLFGLRDPSSGAPGSRSGTALSKIQSLGLDASDVNLFTMTALLIQHNGDINAASAEFLSHYDAVTRALNQQFVDATLAAVDVTADNNDPLFTFGVSTPINNQSANIHGFELQGQYFLGDSGFGVAGSYTKVNGDIGFDIGSDPGVNVFALIGLGDSFNITGIFEKYGVSARIAYNWRGKYLSQLNRQGSRNPVFVEPFGTLDLNVNYEINRSFSVSFEAINILSEPIRTYARDSKELWFAQELHPRFLLGARYRF